MNKYIATILALVITQTFATDTVKIVHFKAVSLPVTHPAPITTSTCKVSWTIAYTHTMPGALDYYSIEDKITFKDSTGHVLGTTSFFPASYGFPSPINHKEVGSVSFNPFTHYDPAWGDISRAAWALNDFTLKAGIIRKDTPTIEVTAGAGAGVRK